MSVVVISAANIGIIIDNMQAKMEKTTLWTHNCGFCDN